jgi:SagB-type dehydrogenase family enzyme
VSSLVFSLRKGISVASRADELEFKDELARLSIKRVHPAVCGAMERLAVGGVREDELTDALIQAGGASELPHMYYYLQRLSQLGILLRSAQHGENVLVTLASTSRWFVFEGHRIVPECSYVLSRFAYMHRLDDKLVVESPLAHARLTSYDSRAAVLLYLLVQPRRMSDILESISSLGADAVDQVLTLLVGAGLARELNDKGVTVEEEDPALQVWEFHDLLFHARSRTGRHDNPVGGTYRFAGRLDYTPALKPAMASEFVDLHRPDIDRLQREDLPYAQVQETRRSIREFGDPPIDSKQVGEFLYRVARVREQTEFNIEAPNGAFRMDFAFRPYPGGGALYELELYLVVAQCVDLAAGMYRYDPLHHRLERLSGRTPEFELLLRGASMATTIPLENIQVLLVVAARFQRMAWKYSSIAYAATLKHVGVLYQTMYLAATAMGLAPCGIGCGDSDLFCRAAGTDYYTETSVGEFLLGSRKNEE